jgi:hypothetical protein
MLVDMGEKVHGSGRKKSLTIWPIKAQLEHCPSLSLACAGKAL